MPHFDESKHQKALRKIKSREQEELAQQLAEQAGLPYVELMTAPINTDALRIIDEKTARDASLAAIQLTGKQIVVAALFPEGDKTASVTEDLENGGYEVRLAIASRQGLERAWELYKEISYAAETASGIMSISKEEMGSRIKEIETTDDVVEMIQSTLSSPERRQTTHLLEIMLAGALAVRTSDIHIEPREEDIRLRYRLDGVLQEMVSFEPRAYSLLLSRVKMLSGMKLNIKDDAQDGRFSIKFPEKEVEVRSSTVPGSYGESIVLRILDPDSILVSFENLGIEPRLLSVVQTEIEKPHGMVLTTGPTGSGKTTTLYSFLRKIKTPENKVITIENPVEYHLSGITQTQVDEEAGYTFLQGLRSALRQDPDVIMVGEIRDEDTARTAVNASLTGHLVFSTLHTNTAAGTIPRLLDLGVNPKVIGSALNIALAQRLVRTLCDVCATDVAPTPEEERLIESILSSIPESADTAPERPFQLRAAGKCQECNSTGYKGRIGIFEAVLMDEAIENLTKENPSEREIRKAAQKQGILTMEQDGMIKALKGITTLEELGRVVELRYDVP